MGSHQDGFSILCTKHEGKLKLLDKLEFDRRFAEFGDGQEFSLYLEEIGPGITMAQRRYFHGPVLRAFMNIGYRKQDAKEMLCFRFIPKEIKLLDGSVIRVPGHTEALNRQQYSDLIDDCIQLAAEEGQVVHDADEWRRIKAAA